MKKSVFCSVFLISSVISLSVFAQNDSFIKEYLERLENSKKYTLLVAEMLPEEKYDFEIDNESMSFAQNLLHICYAMDFHSQTLIGAREARDWQTDTIFKRTKKSKRQIKALVEKTFDNTTEFIKTYDVTKLSERIDYFGLSRTKRQILMLLTDHIAHHRGQMIIMLRINGIKPPRYVLFQ